MFYYSLPLFVAIFAPLISGYYWRDFSGNIPQYAFAIKPTNEYTTYYVGLTFYPEENAVLPSIIKHDSPFAFSFFRDKVLNATYHTKILIDNSNSIDWIDIQQNAVKQKQNGCIFVPGGYANNENLWIGKSKDGYSVGPIYQSGLCTGLMFNSNVTCGIKTFYILGHCENNN